METSAELDHSGGSGAPPAGTHAPLPPPPPTVGTSGRDEGGRVLDASMFQVGRRLGSGSHATVFLARELETGRKYVVKRLDRAPPQSEVRRGGAR